MKRIKILSWMLIATGVLGLINFIVLLVSSINSNQINILTLTILITLPVLGVIAGIFVAKKELWAYILAILYFTVQIPIITAGTFYYRIYSGLELHISMDFNEFSIGINFLAVGMLIFTLSLFKKIKAHQAG